MDCSASEKAAASDRLVLLCIAAGPAPFLPTRLAEPTGALLDAIRECVEAGADLYALCTVEYLELRPVLHQFVLAGHLDCFVTCVETFPGSMDFSVQDLNGRNTVLDAICYTSVPDRVALAMLRAVIFRLETHPGDVVQWWQKDYKEKNFLHHVVLCHRLAVFWPLLRNVPAFADVVDPIPLPVVVFFSDWEQLRREEQLCFTLERGVRGPQKSLQRLATAPWSSVGLRSRQCVYHEEISTERRCRILHCMAAGVPSLTKSPYPQENPCLHQLLLNGEVACVMACLEAFQPPINFNAHDARGRSVLQCVCATPALDAEVRGILSAMLQRRANSGDHLDWEVQYEGTQTNGRDEEAKQRGGATVRKSPVNRVKRNVQLDFLSSASLHERLSVVWPLVRDEILSSGFCSALRGEKGDQRRRIVLRVAIRQRDLESLSKEDRAIFTW